MNATSTSAASSSVTFLLSVRRVVIWCPWPCLYGFPWSERAHIEPRFVCWPFLGLSQQNQWTCFDKYQKVSENASLFLECSSIEWLPSVFVPESRFSQLSGSLGLLVRDIRRVNSEWFREGVYI